jgi:hypothetical protein
MRELLNITWIVRASLAPFRQRDLAGRNDFEGLKTNWVYD